MKDAVGLQVCPAVGAALCSFCQFAQFLLA